MIDNTDINAAVDENVLTAEQARDFENWLKSRKKGDGNAPQTDSDAGGEALRFITNLNDIFITIGLGIFLFGSVVLIGLFLLDNFVANPSFSALALSGYSAGISWVLAEYFARHRRMLLPGMLLVISFVISCVLAGGSLFAIIKGVEAPQLNFGIIETVKEAGYIGLLAGLLANAVFFWRIRLPFCFALFGGLGLGLVYLVMFDFFPEMLVQKYFVGLLIGGGLSVAGAMWFDSQDPDRVSRASDHAFWLHLIAAPQIIYGLMLALAWSGHSIETTTGAVLMLVGLFILSIFALVQNRRALVVASLISLITAVSTLVSSANTELDLTIPLAATIVGAIVLLIGGGWHTARRGVRRLLGFSA